MAGENETATERATAKSPLRTLIAVTVAVGVAMSVGLLPRWHGTRVPWLVLLVVYLGLAAWALFDLRQRGLLLERFRLRPGDTSIGILLGLGLTAVGVLGLGLVAAPGSLGQDWLYGVYRAVGEYQTDGLAIAMLFAIAACEETVWRGMVQDQLSEANERTAPVLAALGYAAAALPSVFLLAPDSSNTNPLLLLASLGAGLVWSFARRFLPRLLPLVISHLVFSYFMGAPLPSWI